MRKVSPRRGGKRLLVIGVGNEFGGDDAAGLLVARQLKNVVPSQVIVGQHGGDGVGLMELWGGVDAVILIDASASGAPPGTVQRFDVSTQPLPSKAVRHSSHAFGVLEAIEMSRALNKLPARFIVFAIEGKTFAAGAAMTPEVERSIMVVAERVRQEIAAATCI